MQRLETIARDEDRRVLSLFGSHGSQAASGDPIGFRNILENLPAAVYATDAAGRITFYNKAAVELAGRTPNIGKDEWCVSWKLFNTDGSPLPHDQCPMAVALREDRPVRGAEAVAERPDGTRIPFLPFPTPLHDADGRLVGAVNLLVDISERKLAEERIAYLAHNDALTGLPNRTALHAELDRLLTTPADDLRFAVICLDLDNFKDINDNFGHPVGDLFLRQVANNLRAVVGQAFFARVGGDEMVLIATGRDCGKRLKSLINRIQAACDRPIQVDGKLLQTSVSVGVALFPEHGLDHVTLIKNADTALYGAKRAHRGTCKFFDEEIGQSQINLLNLQYKIREHIKTESFRLHFQPQVRADGRITGFEALVRWPETDKPIGPAEFIPVAEDTGLILPLSRWILKAACREAATWRVPLSLAVNLSPVQFQHENLVVLLQEVLQETGLEPHRLELEITERVLFANFKRAKATLRALKALGIRIALDDFGTGYSSLSSLESLPLSTIKLDKTFISKVGRRPGTEDAGNVPKSESVVRTIIKLAHALELKVVAEGVENFQQANFLERAKCDFLQGYLFGAPGPIESYAVVIDGIVEKAAPRRQRDSQLNPVRRAGLFASS